MVEAASGLNDVFQGGDEMGALMHAYDWIHTTVVRPGA